MALLRLRHEGAEEPTSVELLFDLVFVFAITQLSGRLIDDLSLAGAGEALLLLLVVWWAWIYTTWMTNWFEPELLVVRIVLLTGTLASLLMAIAIPDAFGSDALLFAAGYVGLQLVRNAFIVLSTDDSEPLHPAFVRILVWSSWVGLIWIAGGLVPDEARVPVWIAALVLDYAGPIVGHATPGLGRTDTRHWEIEPNHFAERFQQFVMIVLGESVVLTGATASGLELTPGRVLALVAAFMITVVLWWLYFDEVAPRSSEVLGGSEEEQGRLARDAYTYLHIPIVAGVIVTAVGNEIVIARPGESLGAAELVALAAGPILYLLGHNAFRFRMIGSFWRARLVAIPLVIAVVAGLGGTLPALATWGIVLALLLPVVAVETRARVRGAALT